MSAWARVWGDFRAMVRDYNKEKLSAETDKLPAIAARAETYASHIQGDYLAGLWRRYLVYDLIWSANNTRPEVSKSGSPSWSWAVINGEVSFDYSNSTYAMAEIVDCSITLVSDKVPFGAVTGGELVIRGYLKEVQVHKRRGLLDGTGESLPARFTSGGDEETLRGKGKALSAWILILGIRRTSRIIESGIPNQSFSSKTKPSWLLSSAWIR
jgi:hypothetical protein